MVGAIRIVLENENQKRYLYLGSSMTPLPRSFRFAPPSATLAVALLVCAAGCASRVSVVDPTASSKSPSRTTTSRPAPEHPSDLLADSPSDAIAAIHRSKCGACHMPVEPGSLPRGVAESAMQRHRSRAKLTEREWSNMVDYLSTDGVHARSTARVP